jgi:hypothetical protein
VVHTDSMKALLVLLFIAAPCFAQGGWDYDSSSRTEMLKLQREQNALIAEQNRLQRNAEFDRMVLENERFNAIKEQKDREFWAEYAKILEYQRRKEARQ